jgi:hypothetical protein
MHEWVVVGELHAVPYSSSHISNMCLLPLSSQAKRDLVSLSSLERKQYNHYLFVAGQLAAASSSSSSSSQRLAAAAPAASALYVTPIEPARRAYCVCRRPHEKSAAMVQCHCCAEWCVALLCVVFVA